MCGTNFSYVYFISFMVIISMLIMNLSVAAVIEGLESAVIKLYDLFNYDDREKKTWVSLKDML
jgi:hypothetical protein